MCELYGWSKFGFDVVDFVAHGIPAIGMLWASQNWWDSEDARELALVASFASTIFHFGWAFIVCGGIDLKSRYLPGAVGDDKVPMWTWKRLWVMAVIGHFTSYILCNRATLVDIATKISSEAGNIMTSKVQ